MARNRRLVIDSVRRRPPCCWRPLLGVLLAAAVFGAAPCTAKEEIFTVTRTVTDTDGKSTVIVQSYYLDTPDEAPPQFVLLVLPGGNGDIRLKQDGSRITFGQPENLFIKNRNMLREIGMLQ